MTIKDLIFELKKRCSFWLNNKTISKKHALECLLGILENEEFQLSLPSVIDEAAEEYGRNTFINECMENGVVTTTTFQMLSKPEPSGWLGRDTPSK